MGLKDLFSGPKINNHTGENLQVCFSHYGPTLGFSGTLTGTKRAICVESIALEIASEAKNIYNFSWLSFRPLQASSEELVGSYSSAPTKFIISPGNIHHYNILFADNEAFANMKTSLDTLSRNWQMFHNNDLSENTFMAFVNDMMSQQYLGTLKNIFYWNPGLYCMTISIQIREREEPLQTFRTFTLSEDDADQLNKNIIQILKTLCGRPDAHYNFVVVPLKVETKTCS